MTLFWSNWLFYKNLGPAFPGYLAIQSLERDVNVKVTSDKERFSSS